LRDVARLPQVEAVERFVGEQHRLRLSADRTPATRVFRCPFESAPIR
jgi:hypothetical protein